jgi:hypothetical protein
MAKKIHFKIIPDSIVKGTGAGGGYYVCETDPPHPRAMHLKDRKRSYVYVHEVVMENLLGKLLDTDKFEVHHKDEDSSNNAPSNLELVSRGDHSRGHAKKNKFWKTSPKNKPKKASVLRVVTSFLKTI